MFLRHPILLPVQEDLATARSILLSTHVALENIENPTVYVAGRMLRRCANSFTALASREEPPGMQSMLLRKIERPTCNNL